MTYHLSGRKVVAQVPSGMGEEGLIDTAPDGSDSYQLPAATWTANCMVIHAAVPGLAALETTAMEFDDTDKPPATSGPNAGNGVAEKRQGKFKGICYRCKAKGHSFRFCPLNEGADVERRVVRPISGYQNNTGVTCKSS